ncbi:MAG: alpha/beta hydrolase [Lacisediminimonas sp.]|nr:alpha/beta hydrolase [Lacisediminimonas sp.]
MKHDLAMIEWRGRSIGIEHQWINRERSGAPLLLFLHEGLGSLSLWRNFPARLCDAAGVQGLVFSRYGYGRSSTRPAHEQWGGDFMQVQALELIPAFLAAAGVPAEQELWLFGHSDGGSIALIMAAHNPSRYCGVIVTAPHTSIESLTAQGVACARQAFEDGGSRAALARHHDDAQSVVTGWADSWLTPDGLAWTIEPLLASITCPVLAIQGEQDAFGTLEQVRVIRRQAPQTQLLELDGRGHVPHFEDPQAVIRASVSFIRSVSQARAAHA